jgi:transcriptional regulator with XRE-family HTH domain
VKYEGFAVGEKIRKLREKNHMSIYDLCDSLDRSVSHISQIEQGRRKMSIDLLFELAEQLKTDANSILGIHCQIVDGDFENMTIGQAVSKFSPETKKYLIRNFMNMINETEQFEQRLANGGK